MTTKDSIWFTIYYVREEKDIRRFTTNFFNDFLVASFVLFLSDISVKVSRYLWRKITVFRICKQQFLSGYTAARVNVYFDVVHRPTLKSIGNIGIDTDFGSRRKKTKQCLNEQNVWVERSYCPLMAPLL